MRWFTLLIFLLLAGPVPGDPLPRPPLTILDDLAALKVGELPALPAEERAFLQATWDERAKAKTTTPANDPRILQAMLFAAGMSKEADQKTASEKIEKIITAAKEATSKAKTPAERGDALLKHLHATTMKGGYEAKQSSLPALLESGKYNCVSSTQLYYLVASRLELKLQPIAIPGGLFLDGHVALDWLDGKQRIQVEPTGPDGFDYATKIKQPGVVIWGPKPDRTKAIDIDPLGLAAATYSNAGVAASKAEPVRHLEAIRFDLSALAIDPSNAGAAKNLIGEFINWGPALQKSGKGEEALKVLQFARKINSENRDLRDNLETVWARHIDASLAAGKDEEAIELTRRAVKDLPLVSEFQKAGRSFERYGWKVFEDKGPEAALAIGERGLKLIMGKDAEELREWRNGIYRRWSQQMIDKKDLAGSLKVLTQAYTVDKNARNIQEGIAYHLQEALKLADAMGGAAAAAAEYEKTTKAFPMEADLHEVADSYVRRGVRDLSQEKKYAEALKRIADYGAMLPKAEQKADAAAGVYDAWGRQLGDEKKWEAALEKYAEGLKLFPKHTRLVNNAAVVVDRWADGPFKEKKYDEAIRIYNLGLNMLPDHPGLKYNLKICEERKKG